MATKDRTEKNALEMDFNEFVTWATGYILFGIGEGQKLRDLVRIVVDHAARNPNFGVPRNERPSERGNP